MDWEVLDVFHSPQSHITTHVNSKVCQSVIGNKLIVSKLKYSNIRRACLYMPNTLELALGPCKTYKRI